MSHHSRISWLRNLWYHRLYLYLSLYCFYEFHYVPQTLCSTYFDIGFSKMFFRENSLVTQIKTKHCDLTEKIAIFKIKLFLMIILWLLKTKNCVLTENLICRVSVQKKDGKSFRPLNRFRAHTGNLFIFTGLKITFVITEFDYITWIEVGIAILSVTVPGLGCTLAHSSPLKLVGGRPYN